MSDSATNVRFDWRPMLRAKPVHNVAAEIRDRGDGIITVIVRNKKPAYQVPPISWFVPFNPKREFTLDPVGTQVWKWCDGENTVERIIELFMERYGLTFHEARTGVTDYLRTLMKRGVIAAIMES